ncbi:MAG: ARPP-1 family domain-containing protein [Candidatus Hermodarchaeota archaeon]
MKNENIQIVSSLFKNPLGFLRLDTPQSYKNMTVIPIILQDDKFIDFISIKEAEELELIEIIETDNVSQLEVINKSDKQILIPFGMTVHGGKQDRTIWEPILLPLGGKQKIVKRNPGFVKQKYNIPAKCVEQSRWNYKKGRGFKTSNTRLHPNVAYEAISAVGQGGVWNEIQSHRAEMKYSMTVAPTQSYLEMTKESDKETEDFMNYFTEVDNQCGIAVFINGEFIGIEFYANSQVWTTMSRDILKAFSIEALRFKEKPQNESINYHDELIEILGKLSLNFSARDGVALGNVVEFNSEDSKWRGITLVHESSLIQFYLVSKRGGYQEKAQSNVQFQTLINQRYEI